MADLDFEGSNTLYGTHGLHAYAAKCPPQLARYGIRYYSKVGETVLDPMAGSGTTLVESRLLGRNCFGFDIDPLARLISEVKSTPLEDDVIEPAFKWVLEKAETMAGEPIRCPEFHNRDYWFSDGVTRDLVLLANSIAIVPTDTAVRNFLWVGLSSLILPKTSVANARDIIHSRHHHWEHPEPPDVVGKFKTKVRMMRRQMREFTELCRRAPRSAVRADLGDARKVEMSDASVDLIFTSPPKRNSKRSLPMTESIYRAVVRHIARREKDAAKVKAWKDCGYFFTSVTGAPLHERNVSEAFYALCGRAKVPCADPFIIQTVLGHSQLSTTRRYTHVPVEVTKAAVTGLESLFEVTREKRKAEEEKQRAAAEQVSTKQVATQQIQ